MKYLDERIIVTLNGLTITEDSTYVYYVRENDRLLFVGNVFLENETTTKDIDITDIIKNDKWVVGSDFVELISTYYVRLYETENTYVDSNSVTVAKVYRYPHYISSMNNTLFDYTTETETIRAMLQGYNDGKYVLTPHYPMNDNFEIKVVSEISNDEVSDFIRYTVEGAYEGSKSYFIVGAPNRYDVFRIRDLNLTPFHTYQTNVTSTNCTSTFDGYQTGSINQFNADIKIFNYGTGEYENIYSYADTGADEQNISFSYRFTEDDIRSVIDMPIAIVLDDGVDEYYINFQLLNVGAELLTHNLQIEFKLTWVDRYTVLISNISFKYKLDEDKETVLKLNNEVIGKIDVCPSPFYLIWQDRFGSFQSQPFNAKNTYSETFDKSETVNYYDVRKLNNVQVQPKWKINSDWISEDLYPYYESIFVSPILILYDSVEDKSYEVIVTGDYTEKTFRNQKQLLNLSLDLELSQKQNITY